MSQFHQHFTHAFLGAFFVQNFGAKNYKAAFWVWNFLMPQFGMKNALIKRWWNWLHVVHPFLYLTYNFSVSYNFQQQINIWSKNLILIFLVVLLAQCIAKIMLKAEFTSQYSREQYHHEFEAFSVWKPSKSSFFHANIIQNFFGRLHLAQNL